MNTAPVAQKIVGIYGSAATQPGTPDYDDAVKLGEALALQGYAVMTGGYAGIMGAISEGAAKGGGHIIGVTVGSFRAQGKSPNPHLIEEIEFPTLAERLNYLIVKPDAYVVLRGGVGTLAELALAWSLLQVGEVPLRPLIAVGKMWREFAAGFVPHAALRQADQRFMLHVDTVDEVLPTMRAWWANPPKLELRIGDSTSYKTPALGDQT